MDHHQHASGKFLYLPEDISIKTSVLSSSKYLLDFKYQEK